MSELPPQNAPRNNPFWTYRDPQSGRWVTLMTAAQCRQAQQVFSPKIRQPVASQPGETEQSDPSDLSAF